MIIGNRRQLPAIVAAPLGTLFNVCFYESTVAAAAAAEAAEKSRGSARERERESDRRVGGAARPTRRGGSRSASPRSFLRAAAPPVARGDYAERQINI